MSKTYGYARVSSKEQHLDRQILRLQEYVEKDQIIVDKQSGATLERPGYQALKGQLGLRAEAIKKNILNDVKDISRNENNNSQGVWHQIFHKLIPDNESLQQYLQQHITGNTCRLTELLDLYLGEVEFLYFEIAQMIIYKSYMSF